MLGMQRRRARYQTPRSTRPTAGTPIMYPSTRFAQSPLNLAITHSTLSTGVRDYNGLAWPPLINIS